MPQSSPNSVSERESCISSTKVKSSKFALTSLINRRLWAGEELPDAVFDLLYSEKIKNLSDIHWTPIKIVRQALAFLPKKKPLKILDVGSGPGKFCLVGALSSTHKFYGIEQRVSLFNESEKLKELFLLKSASFKKGNAFDYDWEKFDVLYFFNPFYESRDLSISIDGTVPRGVKPYLQSLEKTRKRLEALPKGKMVITYHGYGTKMSNSFRIAKMQICKPGQLTLWIKK